MRGKGSACCLVALCGLCAVLAGCQTTGGGAAAGGPHAERVIPFMPTQAVSALHLGEGRYPDLFAPTSSACWAGIDAGAPVSARASAMAEALGERYAVIECRVESAFADMDKAYEVVGLRGINVYLLTPDGRKVRPTKVEPGSDLSEEPVGALRHFGRTNLLVFPRDGLAATVAGPSPTPPETRLVLEGYDSTFYFSWVSFVPEPAPEAYPRLKSRLRDAREDMRLASDRFMDVSHRFD